MAKRCEIICDRCEKVIANLNLHSINILKRPGTRIKWSQSGSNLINPGLRIDLCSDCANQFHEFLKRGNNDVTETSDNV